ncbi:MAG: hypothetical protein ACD_48C00515G0001 [uncultured bacterium]|nr:MAG: hypothetical protein ACD_48C00515G0001 [uncultured bacterium]
MNKQWYQSSVNPEQLSWTVGGFSVLGIAQAITLVSGMAGYPVSESEVEMIIVAILTGIGAITTVVGMIRKAVVSFK